MKVALKCFSSLVEPGKCNFEESTEYEMQTGQTVRDLLEMAGIPSSEVKIVFVNSRIVELNEGLKEGDQIGLAPAVGGM